MEKFKLAFILLLGLISGAYCIFLNDGFSFIGSIKFESLWIISNNSNYLEIIRIIIKLFVGIDINNPLNYFVLFGG